MKIKERTFTHSARRPQAAVVFASLLSLFLLHTALEPARWLGGLHTTAAPGGSSRGRRRKLLDSTGNANTTTTSGGGFFEQAMRFDPFQAFSNLFKPAAPRGSSGKGYGSPSFVNSTNEAFERAKTSRRPMLHRRGSAPLLFTCPDGRKGLHVIHTRLLIAQNEAFKSFGTFRASRILLFRDFALPSIARQQSQSFLYYVSYDLFQDRPFYEAGHDAVRHRLVNGASYLYLPEGAIRLGIKAHETLAYKRVADLIVEFGLATQAEIDSVQVYVTSRVDSDDAVHTEAVGRTQRQACDFLSPAAENRVMVSYFQPKLFWFPDRSTPYGRLGTLNNETLSQKDMKKQQRVVRYKPIMQSLALDESMLRCSNPPLNCYVHQHYEPAFMVYARNAAECPFNFSMRHNMKLITPTDPAATGAIYSRTPGSWYFNSSNLAPYKFLDFDMKVLRSCGVRPGEFAATNLMLASLFAEAPQVAKLSEEGIEGFGGIGWEYSKKAVQWRQGGLDPLAEEKKKAAAAVKKKKQQQQPRPQQPKKPPGG